MYAPKFTRSVRTLIHAAGLALACASIGVATTSSSASAQQFARITKEVGLEPHLDQEVPLDLAFKDETGKSVTLADYFHDDKPVIVTLVYFECPMLCTQVLNGFVRSLKPLGLEPAKDFEIVTVSINPHETPELAAAKKESYLKALGRPQAAAGWHFLTTSDDATIHKLADSIGYHYFYDAEIKEYAHPGVLTILTPKAHISRYFSDVEFSARDLRFALIEASSEKIGSWTDHFLLKCYHYNPETGKYGFVITNVVRLLALLTVAALGGFMFVSLRRERRSARASATS
jgi:protein SCO1